MISRRTVLKLAAAALCPVVNLRLNVPDEKLMLPFCCGESVRYSLESPFGIGLLTYATDAYAMIRAELANRQEIGERRIPSADKVFRDYFQPDGRFVPAESLLLLPEFFCDGMPCPECGDRRVSLGDEYPDFSDPVVDAKYALLQYDVDDNSVRDLSCHVCHGRDAWGVKNVVDVCGVLHSSWLMKRILSLPNVAVCRSAFDRQGILFRADGFEGVSLGLNRVAEEQVRSQ